MTYEENLRKTAEELLSVADPVRFSNREDYPEVWDNLLSDWRLVDQAAYCLKNKAEAYREGYLQRTYDDNDVISHTVTDHLKQLGLIP